jgi:hypothetical protein
MSAAVRSRRHPPLVRAPSAPSSRVRTPPAQGPGQRRHTAGGASRSRALPATARHIWERARWAFMPSLRIGTTSDARADASQSIDARGSKKAANPSQRPASGCRSVPSRGQPPARLDTERRWTSGRDRVRDEEPAAIQDPRRRYRKPGSLTRRTATADDGPGGHRRRLGRRGDGRTRMDTATSRCLQINRSSAGRLGQTSSLSFSLSSSTCEPVRVTSPGRPAAQERSGRTILNGDHRLGNRVGLTTLAGSNPASSAT